MELFHILKGFATKAPGIKNVLYVAHKDWFDVIAAPTATTENGSGSLNTITASHTFISPDHGFIKLELADRSGMVDIEEVGDPEFEAVNVKISGEHPGLNKYLLSLMGKPFDGIILAQDIDCAANVYYQAGTTCQFARKENWKYTTGKAGGSDKKVFTLNYASYQDAAYFYQGAVGLATAPTVS